MFVDWNEYLGIWYSKYVKNGCGIWVVPDRTYSRLKLLPSQNVDFLIDLLLNLLSVTDCVFVCSFEISNPFDRIHFFYEFPNWNLISTVYCCILYLCFNQDNMCTLHRSQDKTIQLNKTIQSAKIFNIVLWFVSWRAGCCSIGRHTVAAYLPIEMPLCGKYI